MADRLNIGIVVPSNFRGGPQKISAIAAADFARNGHEASIFVPVLPYYYYSVSVGRGYWFWVRRRLPPYVKDWIRTRTFCFQDLLNETSHASSVSVRCVPRRASRRQVARCNYLIIHTIAQVAEYQTVFPQERQIYLLHHPEERVHGHADIFRGLRRAFRGKILVVSPSTAREVTDHIPDPPVILDPISPIFWDQRCSYEPGGARRDVLFSYDTYRGGPEGVEIVKALLARRPKTTITVWARDSADKLRRILPGVRVVGNVSERDLCDLYLGHSLLLFPSAYEGFGMPPIEASVCGCIPVLRPLVGAAEVYAVDGENSIYLNGNEMEIARRLADALDTPGVLAAMRVAAREAVRPFDPNGYGARLLRAAGVL